MTPGLLVLVACAAVAIVGWAYGAREERVAGRIGPAALRAGAVFLILGGLALPALRGGAAEVPERVVLLDASRSMTLPVRAGGGSDAAGGGSVPSRLDSALALLPSLAPDRAYLFGDNPVPARPDSLEGLVAGHDASRLEPALRAVRLGGADSVWVVTDGDVDDRAAAVETAEALGLGVREIRVADQTPRVGLAEVRMPERARAGDTVRVALAFRAGAGATPDSVSLRLERDGDVVASIRVPRPAARRTGRAELAFVPREDGGPGWRRYEAVVTEPADPFGVSDRLGAWVEVSEAAAGAIIVSTVPDWEARFLVPALDRLVLGGARGYLRLTDGRFLEMGAAPRIVEAPGVRVAVEGSRLLVVQATPEELPAWLAEALEAHPRTLFLAAGAGDVPGTGSRLTGPLPGEWYPSGPVPASPASALLAEADLDLLPPVRELYAVEPPGRWSAINANRNRRGEGRPLLTAAEAGGRRWAVAAASDWWRWALRGGDPRRVYEGVFSGVVGWLTEDATPRLVSLVRSPAVGQPPVWSIRPGSADVRIRLFDETGAEVWGDSAAAPPPEVIGPALPPGLFEAVVTATGPDGPVALRRPIEVATNPAEYLPGPVADPLAIAARAVARSPMDVRPPRPVWPFLLAVCLLCAEWVWRHRIGLR